jgi:hypothetical protein
MGRAGDAMGRAGDAMGRAGDPTYLKHKNKAQ